MPQYCYLLVEGQHDVEFVCGLLRPWAFRRVRLYDELDPYWKRFVKTTYPYKGDLHRRVPVPLFLENESHSVAVHANEGDRAFQSTLGETVETLSLPQLSSPPQSDLPVPLSSIGVVLDADNKGSPVDRYRELCKSLATIDITMPTDPGSVMSGPPATGAYVLPDNLGSGTLESILVKCAELQYPQLLQSAQAHVSTVDEGRLQPDDLRELRKPAGRNKAVISSISSILRPGRAIQVSIQDNRWLDGAALDVPAVANVSRFLQQLLSLPRIS
jgi:hypothetical protein